ncbi:MAG: endo-1,4-beta-xylanase [Verrucomicrobia bacterium]|nr:endo-1,4-beta-xylanase [Verrucomicrobiota bacterium]
MRTKIALLRGWRVPAAFTFLTLNGHAAAGADLDEAIRRVRMGILVVETTPGAEVRVEQLRHEFWFGAALASQAFGSRMPLEDRDRYLDAFLTHFNAAVTENALKWHTMEPRRGSVDYAIVDAMLAWTDQHGIPLRGHNVFWGVPVGGIGVQGHLHGDRASFAAAEFQDPPEQHHSTVVRSYPRNWAPPGKRHGDEDDRKEEKKKDKKSDDRRD